MLVEYFEQMSQPKQFVSRTGQEFKTHQEMLRRKLLTCASLWPLPERPPLDPHLSPPLDHEWCTVRRVAYQLWPEVYSTGLLYMPKEFAERPAPAVLCPHGHWPHGNADPEVQRRCLTLAQMGYVVFSSSQNHYEDLAWGISHQTLMIWNNVRALDLLESLPEVDKTRIGVAGESGGGLQTQMLVAVDTRVKAATIVGMTCDYREILFPASNHCACNHFPNIMRHADGPELAALGLPAATQFLTMNDWTATFEQTNYPSIRRLYEDNALGRRTDCHYEPTCHAFDKSKRERMYGWMEKWLRGREGLAVSEPEVKPLDVPTLLALKADAPANKGFGQISRIFAAQYRPAVPKLASVQDWDDWRKGPLAALSGLLGEPLARNATAPQTIKSETQDGLVVERILCASEGRLLLPVLVIRLADAKAKLPIVILCDERGKAAAVGETSEASALSRAGRPGAASRPSFRRGTALGRAEGPD